MNNHNNMYGVVNGLIRCQLPRTEELNERMLSRNSPSAPLQPSFSMRPVSTKYSIMPIIDQRKSSNVSRTIRPTFNIQQTFNPGTAQGPWSGFASQVNEESKLRNQIFALQRNEQSVYVPSTNSDMYQVLSVGRQEQQQFPRLFHEEAFDTFNPNTCNLGGNLFDNCTRQQLMGSSF